MRCFFSPLPPHLCFVARHSRHAQRHGARQGLLAATGVDKNDLATLLMEGSSNLKQLDQGDQDVSVTVTKIGPRAT